jgi:hypothetical protein
MIDENTNEIKTNERPRIESKTMGDIKCNRPLPLHTNSFMFVPISPLVFWRAVLDEFAFAANLSSLFREFMEWDGVHAEF